MQGDEKSDRNQRNSDNQRNAELYGIGAGAATLFGGAMANGITIPTLTWGMVWGGTSSASASFAFWSTVATTAPYLIPLAFGVGGAVYLLASLANQSEQETTKSSAQPSFSR